MLGSLCLEIRITVAMPVPAIQIIPFEGNNKRVQIPAMIKICRLSAISKEALECRRRKITYHAIYWNIPTDNKSVIILHSEFVLLNITVTNQFKKISTTLPKKA